MIISSEMEVANHLKKSIIIYPCLLPKVDLPDENYIKEILNRTIHNWEQIINKHRQLSETMVNVNDTQYNIENNNLVRVLKPICREMIIEKELLSSIKKNQIRDNLQARVLYDIIKKHLQLNYLQCIIVKETVYYITVRENQCNNRSQ